MCLCTDLIREICECHRKYWGHLPDFLFTPVRWRPNLWNRCSHSIGNAHVQQEILQDNCSDHINSPGLWHCLFFWLNLDNWSWCLCKAQIECNASSLIWENELLLQRGTILCQPSKTPGMPPLITRGSAKGWWFGMSIRGAAGKLLLGMPPPDVCLGISSKITAAAWTSHSSC